MSVLQRITQERDERVQDLHLDLAIPTWDRNLIGRFTVIDRKQLEKFADKKRSTDQDADFVLGSIDSLWVKDPDKELTGDRMDEDGTDSPEGVYVRLEDENGQPLKFDTQFAEAIDAPEQIRGNGRAILGYCFGANGVALGNFAATLIAWMRNTDFKVAEDLVGE